MMKRREEKKGILVLLILGMIGMWSVGDVCADQTANQGSIALVSEGRIPVGSNIRIYGVLNSNFGIKRVKKNARGEDVWYSYSWLKTSVSPRIWTFNIGESVSFYYHNSSGKVLSSDFPPKEGDCPCVYTVWSSYPPPQAQALASLPNAHWVHAAINLKATEKECKDRK